MGYTNTNFLEVLKLRAFVPTAQGAFTDAEFLTLADGVLTSKILPFMQTLRAEYFVAEKSHAVVANQAEYEISARSIGIMLRDVQIETATGALQSLALIDRETRTSTRSGVPTGFYLRGNEVLLDPTPNAAVGTLLLPYYLRPGNMVETSSAAEISAIDRNSGLITVATTPDAWTTSDLYDLVRRDTGEPLAVDLTASAVVAGASVTLAVADIPARLAVGDWVSLAGYTPIPQIPHELRVVLAQATAVLVREIMGLPGVDNAKATLKDEMVAASASFTPRVTGAPKKVVQRNGRL